jgi:type 1 glutamine amidotransferase
VLGSPEEAALQRFVERGGGWVGIHAAADCEYDWPWYGTLVGAWFARHPEIQSAELVVEAMAHPTVAHLPSRFMRTDEWYDFRTNPRGRVEVLLTIDEATYSGGGMGADHPLAWSHEVGAGRAFYTALGHTDASYAEPLFVEHLRRAIRWAARLDP